MTIADLRYRKKYGTRIENRVIFTELDQRPLQSSQPDFFGILISMLLFEMGVIHKADNAYSIWST